jgi:hypothetical protein
VFECGEFGMVEEGGVRVTCEFDDITHICECEGDELRVWVDLHLMVFMSCTFAYVVFPASDFLHDHMKSSSRISITF